MTAGRFVIITKTNVVGMRGYMATKPEKIKILELQLEEQRKDYSFLCEAYESAKVKNITFLAAGLALLTYLYASSEDGDLRSKLFIPQQPYGVIVYTISTLLFISALVLLIYALRPRKWGTAYDSGQEEILTQQDYEFYLRYMCRRYDTISKVNTKSYAIKQNLLDMSFLPLIVGGILLVVLKTFGG